MKKILIKIGQVLQMVLVAPIKLPDKAVNILKYIAVGLGVLETVLDKEGADPPAEGADDTQRRPELEEASAPEQQPNPSIALNGPDQNLGTYGAGTGERSEADETQ